MYNSLQCIQLYFTINGIGIIKKGQHIVYVLFFIHNINTHKRY